MDPQQSAVTESYLDRAIRLVEEHAELFRIEKRPWVPRVVVAPPAARRARPGRRAQRQLTLPLRPRALP